MKLSLLLFSILVFVLGVVFTVTIIGAIIGVPLIIIGILLFLFSLIWPIRL